MFLNIVNAGAYVSHFPAWLNALPAYLDLIWFAAIGAWSLALLLWWKRPRSLDLSRWEWFPLSATFGLLAIAIHLGHLVFSRVQASPNGPFLRGDLALGGLTALLVTAWWWRALTASKYRPALCAVLAALLLGCAAWRYDFYQALLPSLLISAAAFVTALPWVFRRNADPFSRTAAIAASVIPLFSTIGPIAYGFSMLERYTALSPAGVSAGMVHALAGMISLVGLTRAVLKGLPPSPRREVLRELRPFALAGTAWTVMALAVSLLVGERQRIRNEERALEHVRITAALFDVRVLAPFAHANFRLDNVALARVRNNPIRNGWSDYLATGVADDAVRTFAAVARVARNAVYVRFVTERSGWLGAPINFQTPREAGFRRLSRSVGQGEGRVLLLREPTPRDTVNWNLKAEHVEGPVFTPIMGNGHVFVRSPLLGVNGAMLGWLEFTFSADDFLSETIQARVAPLTGLVLGLIVAALFFSQHHQTRAREAALREAAVAAESSRMKTDFLAKVSHELRTPLQGLLGYSELLQSDVTTASARLRLATLRHNGELMLRLVNDLLDLGAIQAGAFRLIEKPTKLGELLHQCIEGLRLRAEAKNLSLSLTVTPDLPPWLALDAERWRQIVLNLAGNALKFTERGGVNVDLRLVPVGPENFPAPSASAELTAPDALPVVLLELTVRDTGPGISPCDQAKLFQPFARLDLTAKQEGSGLGLALTAALCRSAGGDLTLESDGHSGACFRARLPARTAAAPVETSRQPASLSGLRVLIADDNSLVRELFAAHLVERGAVCEFAPDGEQALARALSRNFDVLVLDLAMPRLDGGEVARRLRRELSAPLRIVGVSAHASASDRARALAAGMDEFLVKPVQLAALTAAIVGKASASSSSESRAELQSRLAQLFRLEAGRQHAAIMTAVGHRDWSALKSSAHYLKSSAAVIGDENLYTACGWLETAADGQDLAAAAAAQEACALAIAPWIAPRS